MLKWILERIHGGGQATETAIGNVPAPGALDLSGLDMPPAKLAEALRVGNDDWRGALDELGQFYQTFGDRLPRPIWAAHEKTLKRL